MNDSFDAFLRGSIFDKTAFFSGLNDKCTSIGTIEKVNFSISLS